MHNHGVWRNQDQGPDADILGGHGGFLPSEQETLAVWLDEAGYTTGLVGKYLNHYPTANDLSGEYVPDDLLYVPPGWDYWAATSRRTEGDPAPSEQGSPMFEDEAHEQRSRAYLVYRLIRSWPGLAKPIQVHYVDDGTNRWIGRTGASSSPWRIVDRSI